MAEAKIRVGIVGTGYAAKLRAEAFLEDERSHLVAIAGSKLERTQTFAQAYQAEVITGWQQLVEREDIDLVVICTINRDHGAIARAALTAGKHVIVEYPLSVDLTEAEELIALAKTQQKLLHVEHIELLGGLHQALKQNLDKVGHLFYVRYSTINPQNPAPRKWTYNHAMFGFPLIGALSRLHRLTDLFGKVFTVNCHQRYWEIEPEYYQTCFCMTQLCFTSGLLAQVIYGKGESLWQPERKFEVHGDNGALIFDGDTGFFIQSGESTPVELGTRRGLFAKDTSMVLDHIFDGAPLYVTPEESLYTLRVADAAQRAAQMGITIFLTDKLN
ncbi:Gfo/Idh/MocA family protein [Anabaena sp. FACHB-709]|uniref:Biliverdin reductase n=2 Tax=Nostocaceae TaxID=1162 RepID=A0A1Z4KLL5_ANAVA|nr:MULTISPECIES: Gfo/Idh/MocA family oxidoreductase [Nostocaceae]BAY69773.1 biliverdin reductase [Trichormus variabilis NIES-23]HBW33282.1 gfo/Idh/MocA family oxidoreductase [Nostoc sp. UBA8866]MBD2172857.1 Gfo/Idh/MocA family oxidoreductase [Anabaena cylindrica FACHB-318]MBD2264518.1 Gfo/Idh/MocA family oxidoreductase [Anabaena sp. FACHB-709]MBD2273786.1 Gfo/Idh/MocA family oxidoreductase [Nostoc sp. PCC 7120 = FACHB-418]